jgi:probable rRNA maturation factor
MSDRPRSGAGRKTAAKKAPAKTARAKTGRKAVKAAAKPAPKTLPLKVDVILEDPAWLKALAPAGEGADEALLARRLRLWARRALAIAVADRWKGSSVGLDCCVVLSSDAKVRRLNRDYRGKDKPTNVLSFAALDGGKPPRNVAWPLGDIILALGTCRKEARAQEKSLVQHLAHLVIHGVLHLLGYDHEAEAEAERMEGLEIAALKRLGIDNPYVTI